MTFQASALVASEILKKKSEVDLALVELERDRKLLPKGAVSQQDYDRHNTAVQVSRAALQEEEARLRTVGEEIKVAQADVATIQTRIDDATLRSPVRGRVLYRLTEVGEVLGAGGKALTLVNLEDVYMEIFLPAEQAARVQIGSEARLTVDHAPGRAAAGYVSFVSPEAQFTPKQVETRSERDKLMFRVKIQVPEELILNDRIRTFLTRQDVTAREPVNLVVRKLFNPNGDSTWFAGVDAIINPVTMLTIILTGAAVIREREHGTLEHLLVMPLSAWEIALAKVWANGLVILAAAALSLLVVLQGVLHVPFAGSQALWFAGVVLYLFFTTALGMFLGTISRSMAQFSLLVILLICVMQLLSGGSTPAESQPEWLQYLTFFLPSRHFVSFSQSIIYRGGGLEAVWPQFLMVAAVGLGFFAYSLALFRRSVAVTR